MREVRVYDGDFPTHDQILSGDPSAAFPKEKWLQEVKPGEFAVRYKDFKTGRARNPAGKHVQSSEICRIFDSLDEAREDSRKVANEHWTVRCFIYDHTGAQVGTVSNNKEVSKFAVVMYAGILLWLGVYALIGMGLIWGVFTLTRLVLSSSRPTLHPLASLGWIGWSAFALAGLLVGLLVWYLRIQSMAKRRVNRMQSKLESIITPEEKKRFEELNTLQGTKDPAERERFLKLAHEYRQKVQEALKK